MSQSVISRYGNSIIIRPPSDITRSNPTAFCLVKHRQNLNTHFIITAYRYNGVSFFDVRKADFTIPTIESKILETRTIVDVTLDAKFIEISDIQYINRLLYVLDKGSNTVIVYDIESLVNGDFTDDVNNRLKFVKQVGGYGSIGDKYGFNAPDRIFSALDRVLILDKNNGAIKEYDSSLNWKATHRKSVQIADIQTFEYIAERGLYMAIDSHGALLYFNKDFTLASKKEAFLSLKTGEVVQQLIYSDNIPNLVYIITNLRILKKYASNDIGIIGFINTKLDVYEYEVAGTQANILFVSTTKGNSIPEDVLCVISRFGSQDDTLATFFSVPDTRAYLFVDEAKEKLAATTVSKHDFHQSLGYAAFEALKIDTINIANMLGRQICFIDTPSGQIGADNKLILAKEFDAVFAELQGVNIASNEHPSPDSINRAIEKILFIQEKMVEIINRKQRVDSIPSFIPDLPPPERV